ncbi:conserved hypothetical Ustilaginaceae-specific protein [Sporisorium reilianum SRZ2]|uniref:Conserved hypothetical Ustilaginaceae-specific protein n=1 Tax=Sporisorium reilianum (strain SRZ2) TaxID=999809 RepID=E6ZMD1_SPORE|nr:conserved hypothetical Ustilaginaceae-specific protein [Sporisorium reilianum SRZ2]
MSLSAAQQQHMADTVDRFLLDDPQTRRQLCDHDQLVSRLLHDRLVSHFAASQWPLERLRDYLNSLSGDPAPTAADPTTPTLGYPLAQPESPRTHRAMSCLPALRQLGFWPVLLVYHHRVWSSFDDSESASQTRELAKRVTDYVAELGALIPELNDAVGDPSKLASALTAAYSQLGGQTFDTAHHALALVLVHAAFSLSAHPKSAEVADANARFSSQFGRKYYGHAPSRFLDFVSRLDADFDRLSDDDLKPYYRGTPIVQSSGTGKTRMVVECRHLTPLLYVCFRPNDAIANAKAGYPFPDNGVVDFFRTAGASHPSLCNLHVACFLGAWFQMLAQSLDVHLTDQEKHRHLLDLNRLDQNNGANSLRHDLFKDITEHAQILLNQATADLRIEAKHHEIFQHYIDEPYDNLQQQLSRISLYLRSLRPEAGAARAPPVIVAFDECVEMNVFGEMGGNNPLNSLRRAWCYISDLCAPKYPTFWLVLLSTSSSAAHLVEHVDAKTSIRSKKAVPLPTFVGVGFDALLAEQQSLSRASEASGHQHIIAYGRPLWKSLEERKFWATARLKLVCSEHFQVTDAAHCFSIMSSRLALSLVPTNSASSRLFAKQKMFMDKAVDRHMRIVNRVTDEAAMYVDSPSEPVLAVAASLIMLLPASQEEQFVQDAGRLAFSSYRSILENFFQRCLLDPVMITLRGTYGELAARLALIVACDAAKGRRLDDLVLNRTRHSEEDRASIISQAVPLETILAGLASLDQDHLARLRQRIRDVYDGGLRTGRCAMQPQGEAADETPPAWVHFTHFDVLPEEITEITPEYLWYCWKRGVALQMAHGQHGIDGIIPVFMGHLDQPFAEEDVSDDVGDDRASRIEKHAALYMTYVAWEAKNQAAAQTIESDELKAAKFAGPILTRASVASPQQGPLTQRALVSVLLDLGTKTSFGDAPRGSRPRLQPITGQDCPRLSIRGALDEHAYPCLDFFKVRPIFLKILTADPTLHDHGHLNTMPNPVWNRQVWPSLTSISAASTAQEQRQPAQINMDLD